MTFGLQVRATQAQVFRLGQVVEILQMTADDLEEHLSEIVRENPFLLVAPRARNLPGAVSATDAIEAMTAEARPSLYEHVFGELSGLIARGGPVKRLVLGLIEHLDPSGWLDRPVGDIASAMGVSVPVVEAALTLVQDRITPAGLFARDLRDCLRLQLKDQELLSDRMTRVLDHLETLESGGIEALCAATGLTRTEAGCCLSVIRRLDPKPGSRFCQDPTLEREPDVTVHVTPAGLEIVFNCAALPDVSLGGAPRSAITPEAREALSQARVVRRMLELRRSALEQVVRCLVGFQTAYFHQGPEGLGPLSLSDIADETGFHLSTVSRVLNGLLIEGPWGIVTARSLCAGAAADGAEHSKPKVQARIRKLIGAETPQVPVSDREIAERLTAEGICVSRRVVAKYRQQIGLPSAARRRRRPEGPNGLRPSDTTLTTL